MNVKEKAINDILNIQKIQKISKYDLNTMFNFVIDETLRKKKDEIIEIIGNLNTTDDITLSGKDYLIVESNDFDKRMDDITKLFPKSDEEVFPDLNG